MAANVVLPGCCHCCRPLQVSQLEAIRKREEANLKALQLEHEALKKEQFKAGQGLHQLRSREKELISEIAGGQSQSKNLSARLKALDEQLLRQSELMYAVDLNLQVMHGQDATTHVDGWPASSLLTQL